MKEKFIIQFSKFLSLIFHPLGMPMVIYLLVRWIDPYYIAPVEADYFVFLLLGINIIAPAISIVIMIKFKMVSSIDLHDRKERWAPANTTYRGVFIYSFGYCFAPSFAYN